MKILIRLCVVSGIVLWMLSAAAWGGVSASKGTQTGGISPTIIPEAPDKVFNIMMRDRIEIQNMIKDYLYSKKGVTTPFTSGRFPDKQKKIRQDFVYLASIIRDPVLANLLHIVQANFERICDLMRQPYTPQNLSVILYYGDMIANSLKQSATSVYTAKPDIVLLYDLRYHINEVAIYYVIQNEERENDRTIALLQKALGQLEQEIKRLTQQSSQTSETRRGIQKISLLWDTLKHLCHSEGAGDLPLVVYRTTRLLDKAVVELLNPAKE